MREAQPLEFRLGFAARFREALQRAGYWTGRRPAAKRFALEHGYDLATVGRWMNGGAIPENWRIIEIARALHVSAGWLLFGEGKESHPLLLWLAGLLAGWSLLAAPAVAGELRREGMSDRPLQVGNVLDLLPLIGRWLWAIIRALRPGPVLAWI